ncbi:formamidopyrimidine-DNA glycosylase [Agaricicola taiwanensis]|uniref:Formamidopyrimidine-DNA glycosylase n=2 Tax=Agaricicola taiwanensis TaxID=591372 RepID=A0A8J2YC04_9RHOB|nr:formamidopyrimidine-DNA glycosylase [Agaricicola taiwanensis]
MHLGMSGSFRIKGEVAGRFHHARSRLSAHDHVVFRLGGTTITYNDPRRFGFMLLLPRAELADHPFFAHLGLEPLGNELSAASLAGLFRGKATSLKAALLDQRLIAGIGNIYACEALHRSGLSPFRAAGTMATKSGKPAVRAERLAQAVRAVLTEAVAAGGSSLRDHAQTNGELGYFQHTFRVYDREHAACPTPGCRGTVKRVAQNGRSTFFCPVCQT